MTNTLHKQLLSLNIASALWGQIWIFLCYNIIDSGGNKAIMEWWQSLLISIAPSVVTAFITVYCCRKSQLSDNTKALNSLIDKIGIKTDENSLAKKIGADNLSITEQIGISQADNRSLTIQHKKIIEILENEKKSVAERAEKFSKKQKDTKKKVEEIADFLQDWEKLVVKNNEQSEEIRNLKEKISELTAENSRLTHILQNAEQNQNDYDYELGM